MPFNRVAFNGVSQVAFTVRDLATSMLWCRAVLGLQDLLARKGVVVA